MMNWVDHWIKREDAFDRLLQEIGKFSAEPIELDAFCELVLKQVVAIFQPLSVGLFLKQKAAGRYHLSARVGLAVHDIMLDLKHPLPVYLDRYPQPLHADRLDILPQFKALWDSERQLLPELNPELFLPLKAGGDLVGILAVGPRRSGKKYTPAEELDLAQLCNQTALAIRLKYLTTAELRWKQEAESMKRALSDITTNDDLEEGLHRALLHIRDAVPYDTASISLLQDDRLVVAASLGYDPLDPLKGRERSALADLAFQSILASREALVVEDPAQDPHFDQYAGPALLKSWLGVPLFSRGEVIGLLAINSHKSGTFQLNPARFELVQAHANQAAVIAEKNRQFQLVHSRRQASESLENIAGEIDRNLDFDQVLELLLERIDKALPSDIAVLFLAEGGQLRPERILTAEELDPETVSACRQPDFEAAALANLKYLVSDQRPVVIAVTDQEPDWTHGPVSIRSWAGTPVVIDGNVIACFTFASLKPSTFQAGQEELLRIFSNQAAQALKNYRLYQEVRQLAVHDERTGLFNQRHFLELGEREFRRARRFFHPLAVMLMEVDDFEKARETYGEDAADQLRRSVADLINANIRSVDIPCRYADGTFAILLAETDRAGAEVISERLRTLVAESPNITTAGLIQATASIGVAVMESASAGLPALLDRAQDALGRARENGRNRVEVTDSASQPPA